ncbi:MAG: hypothetical protein ACE5F2_02855 [Candidatus Paceibacteria bacterium]
MTMTIEKECNRYSVQELKDYFTSSYDSDNPHDDTEIEKHLEKCESCSLRALEIGNAGDLIRDLKL